MSENNKTYSVVQLYRVRHKELFCKSDQWMNDRLTENLIFDLRCCSCGLLGSLYRFHDPHRQHGQIGTEDCVRDEMDNLKENKRDKSLYKNHLTQPPTSIVSLDVCVSVWLAIIHMLHKLTLQSWDCDWRRINSYTNKVSPYSFAIRPTWSADTLGKCY